MFIFNKVVFSNYCNSLLLYIYKQLFATKHIVWENPWMCTLERLKPLSRTYRTYQYHQKFFLFCLLSFLLMICKILFFIQKSEPGKLQNHWIQVPFSCHLYAYEILIQIFPIGMLYVGYKVITFNLSSRLTYRNTW